MSRTLALFTISTMLLAIGGWLSPVSANPVKNTSSVFRPGGDNSGRKLSMVSSRTEDADAKKTSKDDSVEAALGSARETLVGQLEAHKVSIVIPKIDIPDNFEKTADDCYRAVRTGITFAHEHTTQFGIWLARYFKQLSGPPKMTPVGGPYETGQHIVPPTFGQNSSRLYITNEGRLKTVIVR